MHYVGQHMENDLGMNVEYHVWENDTNPNVIGEIPGLVNPDDIFIIGAHIDDVNGTKGADDNASGSVATLLAADILSHYRWGCTLRFALWTGEEQGLNGSRAYAQRAYNNGENILGYLNLDMIAWNTNNSEPAIDLYYSNSIPPSLTLAQLFSNVVSSYNLGLFPQLGTGVTGSDHYSFWQYGFNSILAIEGFNDFNPYYHGSGDTPAHTDPAYFTNFVKASIGTCAHMSDCLIPSGLGNLNGHVTSVSGGSPIKVVTMTADDSQGHIYPDTTNPNGYYTIMLPAGTYTVTASLAGYITQSQSTNVLADQVTTLNSALQEVCEPVSGIDFTWSPTSPFKDALVSFTATSSGTQLIDFQWNFGDTFTGTGVTVAHAYIDADTYMVTLSVTNACGNALVNKDISILQQLWKFFLPSVGNNQ